MLLTSILSTLALLGQDVTTVADPTVRFLTALGVADAEFQVLEVPTTVTAVDVPILLDDAQRVLRLWPHDVRADDFRLIAAEGHVETLLPSPPSVTLRGKVLGEPASAVAGSIVDGRLEAIVRHDDRLFGVQPLDGLGPGVHAVYQTDDLLPTDATCGVPDGPTSIANFLHRTRQAIGTLGFTSELAIDADYEYYQLNGSSTTNTQNDVTNVINAMDGIYGSQFDMDHVITTIIVRSSSNDPYSANGASALLSQFQTHWANNQTAVVRDAAHLFTGRNITGSTIGIANGSSVCSGAAYALSQSRYTGNFSARIALTAHEIGHTMNAYHCNSSPPCRIMCSSLGGCGSISSFGPLSVSSIIDFRNSRDCFDVSSPPIVNSVSPMSTQALEGDRLTLTGCHFTTLQSITMGDDVLVNGDPRLTILNDDQLEVTVPTQTSLDPIDVFVTGPGGDSQSIAVDVVETSPPRLNLLNDAFGNFPLMLDWGASPGELYLIYYTLNQPGTFDYLGFDILTHAEFTGEVGFCDAAGLGHFEVVIPAFSLIFQTLYTQVIFLDGGFSGATQVSSAYFNI